MYDSRTSQNSMLQTLGRYQVLRRIGKGGMGDVWLCEDPTLRRQVAIKTLPARSQNDQSFALRFEREAQATAALNHPHILSVHDYGHQLMPNGQVTTYIVMPYISRGSLADRVVLCEAKKTLLPLQDALRYLWQVAEAIDYAHQQGVIHRDIKPENMLIRSDDWLLLADFGIARMLSTTDNLTHIEGGIGTPLYMAPEQAHGKAVFASDNYSLAVVAYQLFAGRVPFNADTPYAITMQHMTLPPPPPRQFNPVIPPVMEAVLLRGLEKQPAQRPPSASAFVHELQQAVANAPFEVTAAPDLSAQPTQRPATQTSAGLVANDGQTVRQTEQDAQQADVTRRTLLLGTGAVLLAAGGGLGIWAFASQKQPQHQPTTHTTATSATTAAVTPLASTEQPLVLTGHDQPVASLAWSPTGMLASAGSHGDGHVFLWDIAKLYAQQSSSPQPAVSQQFSTGIDMLLAWSPKGDMLAIANAGSLNNNVDASTIAVYQGNLSGYANGYNNTFVISGVVSIAALAWAPSDYLCTITSPSLNPNASDMLTVWNPNQPQKRLATFNLPYSLDAASSSTFTPNSLAIAPDTTPLRLAIGTSSGIDVENITVTASSPRMVKDKNAPFTYGSGGFLPNNNTAVVTWSASGQYMAAIKDASNQPQSFTIWDFQNRDTLQPSPSLPGSANTYLLTLAWDQAPGSTKIAAGTNNGTVYIWDGVGNTLPLSEKKPPATVTGSVRALAYSADGQWLAAAYNEVNDSIVVWKL